MAGRTESLSSAGNAGRFEAPTVSLQNQPGNIPVTRFRIPPDGQWEPIGDTVAICGPKSSPVVDQLLRSAPYLSLRPDRSRRWHLTNRETGEKHFSPMDEDPPADADIAYQGKHQIGGATLVVIAGVHAIGSVGAVHYLARHLDDLHAAVGDGPFSMATTATFHGETIKRSSELCPPRTHR